MQNAAGKVVEAADACHNEALGIQNATDATVGTAEVSRGKVDEGLEDKECQS